MLIDNKFEAQTVTGNSTGNSRCHALASRASNISCNLSHWRLEKWSTYCNFKRILLLIYSMYYQNLSWLKIITLINASVLRGQQAISHRIRQYNQIRNTKICLGNKKYITFRHIGSSNFKWTKYYNTYTFVFADGYRQGKMKLKHTGYISFIITHQALYNFVRSFFFYISGNHCRSCAHIDLRSFWNKNIRKMATISTSSPCIYN